MFIYFSLFFSLLLKREKRFWQVASAFEVSLVNRGGPVLEGIQKGRNTCLIPVCVGVHVCLYVRECVCVAKQC